MYSILNKTTYELEVERSRFIGVIIHIDSVDEIKDIITNLKKEYPKAKHYCYAAITDNNKKFSDDGEPQGTAGKPMLDILEKKELTNVLVVVIRYFGGILLGAGRLLRTYADTLLKTIENSEIVKIVEGYSITFTIDYANYDNVRSYLKSQNAQIERAEFLESVNVTTFSLNDYTQDLSNRFYGKVIVKNVSKKISYMKEGF